MNKLPNWLSKAVGDLGHMGLSDTTEADRAGFLRGVVAAAKEEAIPTTPLCLNCGKKMIEIIWADVDRKDLSLPFHAHLRFLWCACGTTRIVVENPDGALRALWEQENQK